MSLGDARNNGIRKYDSTYYSRIHLTSEDAKTRVNFTYTSGLMKITIANNSGNSNFGANNWEDLIAIFLTGTKAKSLLKSLVEYEKAIEENTITMSDAYGVVTGMGEIQTVIQFHLNKTNSGKAFTIAQIDPSGNYAKRFTFEFPSQYDFRIKWTNIDTMTTEKIYDPNLQYDMFKDALEEFSRTSNGAAGYNMADLARYDYNGLRNLVNAIAERNGISTQRQQGSFGRNMGGGFFGSSNNNQGQQNTRNNTTQTRSLDEIEESFITNDEE